MTPTARSMTAMRETGWHPEVVERFNHWTKRRHDLFGFADILAMKKGHAPILIQTTSSSNLAARRRKVLESPLAALALSGGFRIMLHGWGKYKIKRGGKAMRWRLREEEVTIDQFGGGGNV